MSSLDPKPLLIHKGAPVREACRLIDRNPVKIVLVQDGGGRLAGTVTDGDVRRGLLKGLTLEHPVESVMNPKPVFAEAGTSWEKLLELMRAHGVNQVPLVDAEGRVAGIEVSRPAPAEEVFEEPVVIFAGGQGTRLMPLTERTPKPMLPVKGRPLLELLIERVAAQGFRRFLLAVHHLEKVIEDHIGDGSRLGVRVTYVREPAPLGTAGALRLVRESLDRDFIAMNADLLTSLNLARLMSFHKEGGQAVTLAAREYASRIPFGVLKLEDGRVTGFEEKPVSAHFVYAGVAALKPAVLRLAPDGTFDMPDLVRAALAAGERVSGFPVHESWLDIGSLEDYRRAEEDGRG